MKGKPKKKYHSFKALVARKRAYEINPNQWLVREVFADGTVDEWREGMYDLAGGKNQLGTNFENQKAPTTLEECIHVVQHHAEFVNNLFGEHELEIWNQYTGEVIPASALGL